MHLTFIPLRSIKAGDFKRYVVIHTMIRKSFEKISADITGSCFYKSSIPNVSLWGVCKSIN